MPKPSQRLYEEMPIPVCVCVPEWLLMRATSARKYHAEMRVQRAVRVKCSACVKPSIHNEPTEFEGCLTRETEGDGAKTEVQFMSCMRQAPRHPRGMA